MRVATYSRYSSDQQRAASIEDQQRVCKAYAEREGWDIVAQFHDAAKSGASMTLRPGLQALVVMATAGAVDIVLLESLDRLSRDIADTAGLFKKLRFARVQLFTVSDGEISKLHVGLKGTMSELYLDGLRDMTLRGLRGRIEAGRSGGGRCYGYRVVPAADGEPRGAREIDVFEADIVRRIFREFVDGVAPKRIAKRLNAEGIPGPRKAWSPSTIHGHAGRKTGILNNEQYVGRLLWNRQKFVKHPDTGKRVARPNPTDQWVVKDVPELRIIDDTLWAAAKARQTVTRAKMSTGISHARRPKYLFSGLTGCSVCSGGFVSSSHSLLACFNQRERGICTNHRRIRREEVEQRVLRAMQTRFFEPGRFEEFCRGYHVEQDRLRREHLAAVADKRRELAAVQKSIRTIVEAIKSGVSALALKDELLGLEAKQAVLSAAVAELPMPPLHPRMADVYRQKAVTLAAELEHEDRRDRAREVLRGFLTRILIPAGDELLQVVGNFGAMLAAAAQGPEAPAHAVGIVGCGGGI